MKRKHKIQIPLVLAIVLLLPLLSTYSYYYILMEADFLSSQPKFENTDLDCVLLCNKQEFTASSGFAYPFWVGSSLVEYFSRFYYQLTSPQLKSLVLRC